MRYADMTRPALEAEHARAQRRFARYAADKIPINMARGKPAPAQAALSHGLLTCLRPEDCAAADGTDTLNYGGLDGLPEMRALFAAMLGVAPSAVMAGDNSSLSMMFDAVSAFRPPGDACAFICPAPGYDRHFAICEHLGIEMLTVPMTPAGPDAEAAARLAAGDPAIAGMWCVPTFSNPQGYCCTEEVARRLAAMPAANPAFKLFWDDAYTVHHFRGERPPVFDLLAACARAGHPDRAVVFTSFSKISIPGAAVAAIASSPDNLSAYRARLAVRTVGPDKVNQLRHARFFKDLPGVLAHMERHAVLLRPKFETAARILTEELAPTGAADWHIPDGGYFFALDTLPGCAARTQGLCREAGVLLTQAGATYPYGRDPRDTNLRIAPSHLSLEEAEHAFRVLCAAVNLAALEKLLNG